MIKGDVKLMLCTNPRCRALHVFIVDKDTGERLAMGAVPQEEQSTFIETAKGLAYEAATTKEV